MNATARALAYLVGSTGQSIGLILFAYYISPLLELEYPIGHSWRNICLGLALLAIASTYYMLFRHLIILEKNQKNSVSEDR